MTLTDFNTHANALEAAQRGIAEHVKNLKRWRVTALSPYGTGTVGTGIVERVNRKPSDASGFSITVKIDGWVSPNGKVTEGRGTWIVSALDVREAGS